MPTPPLVSETEGKAWLAFLRERQLIAEDAGYELHRMLTSTQNRAWMKENRQIAYRALDRLAERHPEELATFRTIRRLTQ